MKNNLVIENVTKSFGSVRALDDINITFEENKIYGLLGRNGAGKTTLLNIINNRIFMNEGRITLAGESIVENEAVQSRFFMVGEKLLYPESMKVAKAFKWSANFYPHFDPDYALRLAAQFGLPLKKKITGLSTGYRSIFKNIVALSVNVPFVFLDEPVLGLDANHRELFYKILIEKYIESPTTYVISTHLIEEVANLIEEVVIIDAGKVIKQTAKDRLLEQGYTISGPAALVDCFCTGRETIGTDTLGGLKSAYLLGEIPTDIPTGLELSPLDLQKLFIQLTNHQGGFRS